MKFSRIAWLILVIGVFVIASGSLYWLYLQERPKQEELNEQLSVVQATLPKLAAERADLESTLAELEGKLAQATSQLKTAKAVFPDSVESIEVDELIFEIANNWGLEIISLTATEPRDKMVEVEMEMEDIEVEDVTYVVTSFTADVKGEVTDILNFIQTIVNHQDFDAATVEIVALVIPEPVSEIEKEELSEEEIEERLKPSATITLVVYTYEGE